MKNFILLFYLLLAGCSNLFAQNVDDSIRFCNLSNWNILYDKANLTVRQYQSKARKSETYLFDTLQHIYVMEFNPADFHIRPVQQEKRQKVGRLAKDNRAIAAVNGGFFVTQPEPKDAAVANDFLKIDGKIVSQIPSVGWGNAAVGFNDGATAAYTLWNRDMEKDTTGWSAAYTSVMAAAPMLILNGRLIYEWDNVNKLELNEQQVRNMYAPRTAIGSKADGTIVLLVIDGRRHRAFGASFPEMAVIGKWLGLVNLMNLDGGGSTTMWCNGLVNFPSDGMGIIPKQRKVANALLVLPR